MSLERKMQREREKKLQRLINKENKKRQVVATQNQVLKGFKVICAKCDKTYQMLNARDLKTDVNFDNRSIHKVHHDCPYCLHQHIVCYLNDELIELSKRIKVIRAIKSVSFNGHLTRQERLNKILLEYKEKLHTLNDKFKPESKVDDKGVGESTVNDDNGGM